MIRLKFEGWPWQKIRDHWYNSVDGTKGQKYGWNPLRVKGAGRFGGWWAIKLGITISKSFNVIIIDLVIGSVKIEIRKRNKDKQC